MWASVAPSGALWQRRQETVRAPRIRRPCPATSPFVDKGSAHGDLIRDLSIPQPANMD